MGILVCGYSPCGLYWLIFTAETEGGKGSSRAFSANERGKSKWYRSSIYRNEAQQYQGLVVQFLLNTKGWSSTSYVYREWASTSAGWPRSSTSSRRGFVINSLCSYQVTVVYTKEKLIHTSGLGVESASLAGTLQKSDSVAVCGIGAWASAIHGCGCDGLGWPPPWEAPVPPIRVWLAGMSIPPPSREVVHLDGVMQQLQEGRRIRRQSA